MSSDFSDVSVSLQCWPNTETSVIFVFQFVRQIVDENSFAASSSPYTPIWAEALFVF